MPWENYFDISQTFALDSVVNSDYFRHANFAALKVKDAIVDRFRSKFVRDLTWTNIIPTLEYKCISGRIRQLLA